MDEAYRQQLFETFVSEGNCLREQHTEIRSLSRRVPYYFSTPRPMSGQQLSIIGSLGSGILLEIADTRLINLIGIANAGLPIAAAIANSLSDHGKNASLLILDKAGKIDSMPRSGIPQLNILVDNAIITGRTLCNARQALLSADLSVDYAISIFDHELEELSSRQFSYVREGRPALLFLFSFRNLIQLALNRGSKRADVYLDYARNFGNARIRSSSLLNTTQ